MNQDIIKQLKSSMPDFAAELKPELDKKLQEIDIRYSDEYGTLNKEKVFYSHLAELITELPAKFADGFIPDIKYSRRSGAGYSITYQKPACIITTEVKAMKAEARKEFKQKVRDAETAWLDEMIESELQKERDEEARKIAAHQQELKDNLLKALRAS